LVGRHNALDLASTILKEKLSARSIENLVKNDKEKEKNQNKPKQKTDVNILLAQRKIEESLGLKTTINKKKNNSGKIVIEFSTLDQFDMVSNLLKTKK